MSDTSSLNSSSPASSISTLPSSVLSTPELSALNLEPVEVSEEDKAEALCLKASANKAFTSHDFPTAAKLYSEAITKNPNEPTLWCNRAYTRMKLEEYGYALSDAAQAIKLDPRYAKAYYRRATCYMQILKPASAVSDFKKVLALEPKNESVKAQLVSTQKLIRKIEFEKAIEMEGEKSPIERCYEIIAEGGCDVDSSYAGPKLDLENEKYTIKYDFIKSMIQWFKDGKSLPKRYVWEIVLGAHEHFSKEDSLINVNLEDGITCDVIGDVHGQYYDMLHLFSLTGEPNEKHYLLMNGDLVDRGSWSIEVILTAFAFKWLYPKYMFINRGNHETKDMNRAYGFEGEAKHKHGEQSYKLFAHVFTTLPLATLVSATKPPSAQGVPGAILSPEGLKRYFVVHGGLFSKDEVTLEDVRKIDRIGRQPGQEGLMCEVRLLWTDPQDAPGRGPSKRGVGIGFGPDVTKRWCTLNGVTGIIRSHEVRQEGYQIEHNGLCTTVFSAPNYVDQGGNKGAFIRIDSTGNQQYHQFEAQPHPNLKPMAYQKVVDDAKLSQYAAGTVRKSRREKEQEAAEAKKREEEASAARAYAEFIDAFEGQDAAKRKVGSGFVKAGAEFNASYAPGDHTSFERPSRSEPSIKRSPSPPLTGASKPKGKRAMDAFLEEIKKDQAEREAKYSRNAHGRSVTALAAYEGQSGSKDRGDPQTSNVFVANLPPHVTEQTLGNFFARAGPVGSVKVMWPRTDASVGPGADMTASRRTKSTGLSGFVSFMKRKDAERALREFDGFDWGGSVLRVGWSKAVPIAAKPLYAEVKGHGATYEKALREREENNSKYAFLLNRHHRRHAFYRGLIESEQPLEPEFDDEGYNSVYSTDSAEESERERVRKTQLGRLARRRFESMLRALSGKRGEVARCMAFSLEHAEAAHEVADIIVASLLVDGTAVPRKVARLHLICDILHNSAASVPSAWKFRLEFQSRLGIVFDHLANIYHSFPGRITAETFKKQITAIVDIWEDWIVFPPDFTSELRLRLDGVSKEIPITVVAAAETAPKTEAYASRFKASTFTLATPQDEASGSAEDGEPMDVGSDVDGELVDDVDGVPVEDVDGVPLDDDVDGEPVPVDLDGESINDVDGLPMEEDIDGEPLV
ncbi:hypothetical protein H0H87_011149 [Tephrocybe sp. NHM501043]|nr:hypothetical protein H0H87_011149 [Tephrocybe sp. NHM501043]